MVWNEVVVANFRYYISICVKVMRIVTNSLSGHTVLGPRCEAGTYGISKRKGTLSTEMFDVSPSETPLAMCGNIKYKLTYL